MFSSAAGAMSGLASSALNKASSFLGSSVGQSLVSGGAIFGGDFGSGFLGHYFGKKSSKYNAQKQREMANYMMNLQKKYNEWLIPFQNESNMEYQLRYANGRPQAEVAGLRAAGLNPILAASGGFHSGSMSGSSASSIPSSPSSQYVPSTGKGSKYYDPLLAKQLDLLQAQIDGQKIKNNNDMQNRGLSGKYGAISRVLSETDLLRDNPSSSHRPTDIQGALDDISSLLNDKSRSPSSNSEYFIRHRPVSSRFSGYDYLSDKMLRSINTSDLPYDKRKLFYDAVKEVSPITALILSSQLEPTVYRMPRPPRGNATHNELRKFWRDERKRKHDLHGWKIK